MGLVRPNGYDEIVQTYGNIRLWLQNDGTLSPDWERAVLDVAYLPDPLPLSWDPKTTVKRIRCHRKLAYLFEATFQAIHREGLWKELKDYGGCYAFRPQRGASKLSLHSWGAAIDLNVKDNPLGEHPNVHSGIVQIFEAHGFEWGGRWKRPDGMHFQYATNY